VPCFIFDQQHSNNTLEVSAFIQRFLTGRIASNLKEILYSRFKTFFPIIHPPPDRLDCRRCSHKQTLELLHSRWMPHIKLAYPFLSPTSFASSEERFKVSCQHRKVVVETLVTDWLIPAGISSLVTTFSSSVRRCSTFFDDRFVWNDAVHAPRHRPGSEKIYLFEP